jgi:hypothetical protein
MVNSSVNSYHAFPRADIYTAPGMDGIIYPDADRNARDECRRRAQGNVQQTITPKLTSAVMTIARIRSCRSPILEHHREQDKDNDRERIKLESALQESDTEKTSALYPIRHN